MPPALRPRRAAQRAACLATALCALAASPAQAQPGLTVAALERVRVDGALLEWGGVPMAQLGDGADSSMAYALAYNAGGLYFGARVRDDRVSATPGPRDAVILTLAFPESGRLRAYHIALYPGRVGQSRAFAAMGRSRGRLRPAPRIEVVEGPLPDGQRGYTLEAFVPRAALPALAQLGDKPPAPTQRAATRLTEVRGTLGLVDVDRETGPGRAKERWATPEKRPARLPRLRVQVAGGAYPPSAASSTSPRRDDRVAAALQHAGLGGAARGKPSGAPPWPERAAAGSPDEQRLDEAALLRAFRRDRGLSDRLAPRFRLSADLVGSDAHEIGMLLGRYFLVIGPEFHEGRSYIYYELPVQEPRDILSVSTVDLAGDPKHEVIFRIRERLGALAGKAVERELLLVHRLEPSGFPRLLRAEVSRRRGRSFVRNQVVLQRPLTIHPGRARGFGPRRLPAGMPEDIGTDPLLLPWRDAPRRYRWDPFRGRFRE